MGMKKGQIPKPYADGKLVNLKDRTEEERKRISQLGVEARKKNKEKNMQLQACMRQLLTMKTNSDKKKQILRSYGFTDADLTNQTLLMVALFQKGLTGDVGAIKEITQMMDKLDMYKNTGRVQNDITINLVAQGDVYQPNKDDEQEIWNIENSTDWIEKEAEAEEEWGTDVYDGE